LEDINGIASYRSGKIISYDANIHEYEIHFDENDDNKTTTIATKDNNNISSTTIWWSAGELEWGIKLQNFYSILYDDGDMKDYNDDDFKSGKELYLQGKKTLLLLLQKQRIIKNEDVELIVVSDQGGRNLKRNGILGVRRLICCWLIENARSIVMFLGITTRMG